MATPRLEARRLTFGYRSDSPLFAEWSASFDAGEVVAITGASGRGKSTLLYLLGLMLKPTSGEVLVDGWPAQAASDHRRARLRARRFGFVFQDAALDATRTVIDNVVESALYRGQARGEAVDAARALLDAFGVSLPPDAKPGRVSGGQAQRVALCRALLTAPDIVLADEPTGNLDAGSAAVVIGALRKHADSGACVAIVTHDPFVVEQCDRSIRL